MAMTKFLTLAVVACAAALAAAEKPTVEIVSSKIRANDPKVMDVEYCVHAESDSVDVRAIAYATTNSSDVGALDFQSGMRSFANVVSVKTFESGKKLETKAPVTANTTNSFAWKVGTDWGVDLGIVTVEILAKNADEALVPLELVTIPADGTNVEMTVSRNALTRDQVFDALLWCYADGDSTLTLENGTLSSDVYGPLASGGEVTTSASFKNSQPEYSCNATRYLYEKMGYQYLNDSYTMLQHAREALGEPMVAEYGYALECNTPKTDVDKEPYMIVDLTGTASVSYLDDEPGGGWGDEYKTKKIVLRRIKWLFFYYGYVGVFPITRAQWAYVMGDGSESDMTNTLPKTGISYDNIRGSVKGRQYPDSTDVDADSFMGRLRAKTGIASFDLPTTNVWELAAGGVVTDSYLFGDTTNKLDKYAWYSDNSGATVHEVGRKEANSRGLYDVHGNVWEWCLDWHPEHVGWYRVLRGGAYDSDASKCSFRHLRSDWPSSGWNNYGFRLFCR